MQWLWMECGGGSALCVGVGGLCGLGFMACVLLLCWVFCVIQCLEGCVKSVDFSRCCGLCVGEDIRVRQFFSFEMHPVWWMWCVSGLPVWCDWPYHGVLVWGLFFEGFCDSVVLLRAMCIFECHGLCGGSDYMIGDWLCYCASACMCCRVFIVIVCGVVCCAECFVCGGLSDWACLSCVCLWDI